MVLELLLSVLLSIFTLVVVLKKTKNSNSFFVGYIIFLIFLTLIYAGSEKAILIAISVTPFLYLLHISRLWISEPPRRESSTLEKLFLYLSVAPFFVFLFYKIDFQFYKSDILSLKEIYYIPEYFLIILTLFSFFELIGFKGEEVDN